MLVTCSILAARPCGGVSAAGNLLSRLSVALRCPSTPSNSPASSCTGQAACGYSFVSPCLFLWLSGCRGCHLIARLLLTFPPAALAAECGPADSR